MGGGGYGEGAGEKPAAIQLLGNWVFSLLAAVEMPRNTPASQNRF